MKKVDSVKKLQGEIKKLKKLAYFDELTGLFNRHGFKEEARRFLSEVYFEKANSEKRKNLVIKNFGLIFFDIDYFKKVNDTYGHPAGDKILKIFGETLLDRVRSLDLVARWGGEEMVAGLPGASEKDAREVAENIRRRVEDLTVVSHGKKIKFTISAGVAATDGAVELESLLEQADRALYHAKHSGRNRVVKFSDLG